MHRLRILLFSVCTLTLGGLLACAADGRGDDGAAREVEGALSQQQQPRADAGARDRDVDTDEDVDETTDEANDVDTDSDEDCDSDSDETQDEANDVDTDSDSDERCGAPAAPVAPANAQSRTP